MLQVQKDTGLYLFTTDSIAGNIEIEEYFGLVSGSAIYGGNFIKDYFASIADRIGGRVRGYESAMNGAIETALKAMAKQAKQAGANAVIAVRISHGDVNNRMMMANCYGTAIRFRQKPE